MDIEAIWEQYRISLKRFLQARVSNPADVEDLLQVVLLKSYQNLAGLKDSASLKPWLFQIASHAMTDFYRARSREQALLEEPLWYQQQEAEIIDALADCLLPFMAALPPEQAELIRSIDLQGKSQQQVAAEQQIPYSTLKSRVQHSRRLLRQLFESCCQLELDHQGRLTGCDASGGRCDECE